jgi:uncharacterized SAM-binding protein YcdF (DUF218 family)
MMFFLSKVGWGFFQPSSLIAGAFALAFIFMISGKHKGAMRALAAGAILYGIFGFSPLANFMLATLETTAKASAATNLDGAAGIIVLGGGIESATSLAGNEPHLNESGDRMTEAVRLAGIYPSIPVFFSGGKAEVFPNPDTETEAALALRFFARFGLRPPRVLYEERSRNTYENAIEAARELHPQPGQKWILVTSAFHMPRAKALFERQGFELLVWPVDFRTNGFTEWWRPFTRASDGLRRLDLVAKEWVGFAVSWARGELKLSGASGG